MSGWVCLLASCTSDQLQVHAKLSSICLRCRGCLHLDQLPVLPQVQIHHRTAARRSLCAQKRGNREMIANHMHQLSASSPKQSKFAKCHIERKVCKHCGTLRKVSYTFFIVSESTKAAHPAWRSFEKQINHRAGRGTVLTRANGNIFHVWRAVHTGSVANCSADLSELCSMTLSYTGSVFVPSRNTNQ